jgi:UrcA family protein
MLKILSALASLAAASAVVVPTVSYAEDTLSVRVPYSDLNLASLDGQGMLKGRISTAARSVCGGEFANIEAVFATSACRGEAIAAAQPAYEEAVAAATRHGTVTVLESASLVVARP